MNIKNISNIKENIFKKIKLVISYIQLIIAILSLKVLIYYDIKDRKNDKINGF